MSLFTMKVSAVVATGLICLATGVGAGILGMKYVISDSRPKLAAAQQTPPAGAADPSALPARGRPGGGPAGGGPGGPGGRGSNSKTQLATLVVKLDQLTQKQLTISLNKEQQEKLREQLQDLNEKAELSEDDAKKRLDAIHDLVKSDKETLEAAGYRWPGPRGSNRPPATPPNPFKDEQNARHLKSLQDMVGKAKSN